PKWRRFVRKALSDDPDARFQSVGQVISALSVVESQPAWHCSVAGPDIRWERQVRGRRTIVRWVRHSARKYTWEAWSEPVAAGRRRSLGQSASRIGYTESERQLRELFAGMS